MENQGEDPSVNAGPASPATPEPVARALFVLITDDNPLMQELVSTVLKGAGYETELAENGQIALAKLEKADFDLIIMDNDMPVMTGIEAIKIIRSRADGKRLVPILSLTAGVVGGSSEMSAPGGANVHMEKPFKVRRLLAAVTTLARHGRDLRINGGAA